MITPVRALKVGVLCERKDDLLVSVDDIKMVASKEREKAIDEFSERLAYKIKSEIDDCADELEWIEEIAEQLKGGAV